MNEQCVADCLIRLDSAFSDKKWLDADLFNRLLSLNSGLVFQNFLDRTSSNLCDTASPEKILAYFDEHHLEYLTLTRKDIEDVFNKKY